jgi:hypothetical protein
MRKSREYYEDNREDREGWRWSMPTKCMICGWEEGRSSYRWLETHEIEPRSLAQGRWAHRCNYLLLCNHCHHERIPLMSHAEQLAYKIKADRDHFDLDSWLRLRDPELRAPCRVRMEDIEVYR